MARVTLSQPGEDVFIGGSDVEVFGTNSGGEVITVLTGSIRLDASFNRGGDTIVLPGPATSYSAYRVGSDVVITRADNGVTIRIPFGTAGVEVQFDGNDSRTLLFDVSVGQVTLEGQTIGTSSTSPTPLAAPGATPAATYDVVGSNASIAEGDSGTKVLQFTIGLDKPVGSEGLTLNYQTQNGTATAGSDYVAAAGTVTFAAGQQTITVSVTINGDTVGEGNETFNLLLTGAQLRNGPETLTGTIINDDGAISLTGAADDFQGSASDDTFFAANAGLGAGDKITDSSTADNDTFSLAVDASATNRNFGGFALTNIENVEVTNTSGADVRLDLASSTNIETVASVNSSDTVIFDQLTSNATVIVNNVTGATANVQAIYQAAVTSGANTAVNVIVDDSTANQIILGTVGAGNTGIETVNLTVTGTSTINGLVTQKSTLNIGGGGDITLSGPLVDSVRTVNASGAGRVTVDFSNNDDAGEGVTFTGSNGADVVRSGAAADTLNTGAGNDAVIDEGGNDVINTGTGNDTITLLGAGDVTIDTGADNDTVSFAAGTFNGSDKVAFGAGADTLILAQSTVEGDYAVVTDAETLTIATNATTNLGNNGNGSAAQTAGIRTVNLNLTGAVNASDTLIAADYTEGLTVNLGGVLGSDSVLLGSGADVVNTSSFDSTDSIQGGLGVDTINITDGITTLFGGNFSGVEVLNYVSDGDGHDQILSVDDANAPTTGSVFTVNAGDFTSDETFTFSSQGVTAFSVNVTTGAGNDSVYTDDNDIADVVSTGAGDDLVRIAGGDTANTGSGVDTVFVGAGNNIVNAGEGNDRISLVDTGNDTLNGEDGDDVFTIEASAFLTAADVISGGSGTDTIEVAPGTYTDAQFTGVTSVEVLSTVGGLANVTIAAEAQEAGIRTVNLTDGGADRLDASDYTVGLTVNSAGGDDEILTGSGNDTIAGGAGDDIIVGGLGGDLLDGGAGADTFVYYSVEESRLIQTNGVPDDDQRDVIDGFVAGVDKIDLTQMTAAVGQVIRFAGEFNTYAEAQGAVGSTANDGFLDVAFVQNLDGRSILFVDVDNNGQLDGNDLQILFTNKVGTLTAPDVNNPHTVTGPLGVGETFNSGFSQSHGVTDQYVTLRMDGGFDSLHIA